MRALVFALAFLGLTALSNSASAYPHFQFSSGTTTCNLCHYDPAGGGLITSWGREEAADTLSRGGNGEALHGAVELPSWLDVGGDIRLAGLVKNNGDIEGNRLLFFPMQADLRARVMKGSFFAAGVVGLRGKARPSTPPPGGSREEAGFASRIVSRAHYIGYRAPGSKYTYRMGRFYAPYGLRLPDHTSYTRRHLGFDTLRETYGLSLSRNESKKDLHITAHVSDVFLGPDIPELGLTAMHERRGESHALGASFRGTRAQSNLRLLAGTHYKKWIEDKELMLMAELDAGFQRFEDSTNSSRFQLAAHIGPVWFPTEGVSAALAYEFFDPDVRVKYVERQSLSTWISVLPRAHYEVILLARGQRIGPQERVFTAMMQLHYYL